MSRHPAVDDSLQLEARALGDPTRHRIFRYIAEADHPVSIAELTELVALNHNAVRQHLAVLKQANLVQEEVEVRERRGRPRLLYRLHPEASERWSGSGPYAWLAGQLARALQEDLEPRELGRQEGHRRAAELAGKGDSAGLLEDAMARLGFRPNRSTRGRRLELVLERCPFAEVAESDPQVVCQLHLGLAEGLAEGLGGLEIERLVAKRPRAGGCRLVVTEHAQDPAPAD